jgi:prepilin-type N-terminal cleavage/methylation domain-containing protein
MGRAAFTLIELLVVIAIIGLLAGLMVGGTKYAGTQMKVSRIRAELQALEVAIEAYHAKFNHYPPDNVVSRSPVLIVNPVTNSLYYALTGVIAQDAQGTFRSPNGSGDFTPSLLKTYFGVDGIENAGTTPKEIKPFITLKSVQYRPITTGQPELDVLVVPVPWPLSRPDQPTSVRGLNTWRYVSTQPTNNPATFDLWAEYVDGGKIKIICNWSKDILEK